MENARGQDRVGLAFQQYRGHVFQVPSAPTRHDWHPDRFADAPCDREIIACSRAVRINAVQDDLASALADRLLRPADRVQASRFAASVRENLPSIRPGPLGINGNY